MLLPVSGAGSYTVTPSKDSLGHNGVSSFDAARIIQHILGMNRFNANQAIAADVSGNNLIQSFDAALIARFVAFLPGTGITGTWVFSPPNRIYSPVGVLTGQDYSAFLMGDVSGDWTERGLRPANGPERAVDVELPKLSTQTYKEIVIPVTVKGAADKGIISYEFDLRYDPSVIQPLENPADLLDTISRGLSVVTNQYEPGLLRIVVYGPMPIDENGLLLNLRFTAVGAVGSTSPLVFERIMFNEGEQGTIVTDGQVVILAAN